MQSTTTTGSEEYVPCMVSVGKWANTYPNLNQQQRARAIVLYNEFYGLYLQTSVSGVQPAARPARQQQTQAATGQRRPRSQGAAAQQTTGGPARVRTPPGQLGQVDSKVLAQIVANPNIATEALHKRPALRSMKTNILGTCIGRLLRGGYIAGTAKVGPFSATPQGIDAGRKQPASINQARARRAATTSTATEHAAAAAG